MHKSRQYEIQKIVIEWFASMVWPNFAIHSQTVFWAKSVSQEIVNLINQLIIRSEGRGEKKIVL